MLQHASSSLSAFFNNYTLHYNNFILKVGLKVLLKIEIDRNERNHVMNSIFFKI